MKVKEPRVYRVNDVMKAIDVSESQAYKIIRELNKELREKGKLTVAGRVSVKYFEERMY